MQQTNPEYLYDIVVSVNFNLFIASLYVVVITGFGL